MIRLLVVYCLLTGSVMAQSHKHGEEGGLPDFYARWDRPDKPGVSCCSVQDCAPAASKMVGGRWMAKRDHDATWRIVPPERVETRRDSPDGRSHLCAPWGQNDIVYCFLPGAGT